MPPPPRFHVRPVRGWLNDPNGITRHGGRWHVFYQHNPARAQHGDIAWGHVSSPDLVRWTDHPVAFSPTPDGPDRAGCWSGSQLPWLDVPAVVYTGVEDGPERSTVCVRTALDDDLDTWSDPVVVAREPEQVGVRAMRDPAPFIWQGRRYALLGAAMTDGSAALLLFSADDPLAWRYEGVWLDQRDPRVAAIAPADVWECPQLVRFGATAVVVLSLQTDRRLEDVVHLVGALGTDPATGLPTFVARGGGRLDLGPDFYAPLVVADGADEPLLLGWVREADAPDDAPPDAVAGCLTLPRRLALHEDRVAVRPDPALDALLGPEVAPAPELPPYARVVVEARSPAALVSGDVRIELAAGEGPYEVWLDGPVAEVFRPGGIASTARAEGPWRLEGERADATVSVRALAPPA